MTELFKDEKCEQLRQIDEVRQDKKEGLICRKSQMKPSVKNFFPFHKRTMRVIKDLSYCQTPRNGKRYTFQNAGYKGLYGGLGVADIKEKKQIDQREELLDRMGRAELAANDFRITQTEERLQREETSGQTEAIETHHEVGKKVRKAIEDIGGTMPENLAAEPSLKPLLDAKHRKRQRISSKKSEEDTSTETSSQNTLWE